MQQHRVPSQQLLKVRLIIHFKLILIMSVFVVNITGSRSLSLSFILSLFLVYLMFFIVCYPKWSAVS